MFQFKCVFPIFIVSLFILAAGCGNTAVSPTGDNTAIEIRPSNQNLQTLDNKLAAISDESTALDAVDAFAGHVLSNLDQNFPQNASAKMTAFSPSIRNKFAAIEAGARRHTAGLSAASVPEDELVSPDKLTSVLNGVQEANTLEVTADQIKTTQRALREAVPHLASTDNENMTPLEASIISYYMMTGDDGSSSESSVPLRATQGKLEEFASELVSREGQ